MNDISMMAKPIDNAVTQALAETLAEARAGRVHGVVIVKAYGPEQWSCTVQGGFTATLSLGCDIAKHFLRGTALQPASPILRATGDVSRN